MQATMRVAPLAHRGGTARLRSVLAAGLVAVTISLGTGVAMFGALTAAVTVAAGGLGVAHDACQRVETNLAADLGMGASTLRRATPAEIQERLVAREEAGLLSASAARRTAQRATAYDSCRQTFGPAVGPTGAE